MNEKEIKELLEKQMFLLSQQSKKFKGKQLIDASFALAELAKASNYFLIAQEERKACRRC